MRLNLKSTVYFYNLSVNECRVITCEEQCNTCNVFRLTASFNRTLVNICCNASGPPILSTIAVWIKPGAIPLHLISGPNSHAMDLVSPIMACLLSTYAANPWCAPNEATEHVFTMVPFPFSFITGATNCVKSNVEVTFTLNILFHSSMVKSINGDMLNIPALLNNTSTVP